MTVGGLVGRQDEQSLLHDWRGEPAQHVLVSAAPGLGRSALLAWLAEDTRAGGDLAFLVTGTDPEAEPGFGPWVRLAIAAARAGIEVPPQLLVPPEPGDGTLADTTRYVASLDLLEALGAAGAVVAFDDVHHLDVASLELLAQLVTGPQPLPVLLVVSTTSSAQHPETRGRRALGVLANTQRHLHLDVLTPEASQALLTASTPTGGAQWVARWSPTLHALAGGSPRLLTALLKDLRLGVDALPELEPELSGKGSATRAANGDRPAWAIRVTRTLQRHLEALEGPLRSLLVTVALADGALDEPRLARVIGSDVDEQVSQGRALGLLRPGTERLQLTHPLVAGLLAERAGPDAPALHGRIGQALLDDPRDRRDMVLAVDQLLRSGVHSSQQQLVTLADALLRSSPDASNAADDLTWLQPLWLRVATEPDPARWRRLGLRLADAYRRAGQLERSWSVAGEVLDACPAEAIDDLAASAALLVRGQDRAPTAGATVRRLLATAERLGDHHPQTPRMLAAAGEVALPLPSVGTDLPSLHRRGPDGAARDGSGAASPDDERPGDDLPAGPAASAVLGWTLRAAEAGELVERAEQLLAAADPSTATGEVQAVVDLAWIRVHRSPQDRTERLLRADRAARLASDPALHANAMARLVVTHLLTGARPSADRALEELRAVAHETNDAEHRARERTLTAMLTLASGDPATAQQVTAEAFALGQRAGVASSWSDRVAQAGSAAIELDTDLPDLGVDLEVVAELHPLRLAGWCWASAVAPGATGGSSPDPADLLELVDRELIDDGWTVLLLTILADVAWRRQRRDLAPHLISWLEPWQDLVAVDAAGVYCHGSPARPLAGLHWLVGNVEAAAEAEGLAAEVETRAGLHRWRLTGEIEQLHRAALDQRISRDDLRHRLTALTAEARQRQLHRLVGDARSLLAPTGGVALTDRQLTVLRGLATGATYAQIADSLRFSHSTVRKDAISTYRALEVAGRDEAVALATALGLVDGAG